MRLSTSFGIVATSLILLGCASVQAPTVQLSEGRIYLLVEIWPISSPRPMPLTIWKNRVAGCPVCSTVMV